MVAQIGERLRKSVALSIYTVGFFGKTLRGVPWFILRGQASWKILIMQVLFTFVEALGIACVLAMGIGAAINLLGLPILSGFSQGQLIYPLMITVITRELGPLLMAFIIIARSATAIATEVAGMVVSHEIEAYISVGVDPVEHIVVPRFLGVTISLFLLNIYFSLFGLGASFLVVQILSQTPATDYFDGLLATLTIGDVLVSLIKSVLFGMIIAIVATVQGFSVERASTEIPQAGLRAVGSAFAWCFAASILVSVTFYML